MQCNLIYFSLVWLIKLVKGFQFLFGRSKTGASKILFFEYDYYGYLKINNFLENTILI